MSHSSRGLGRHVCLSVNDAGDWTVTGYLDHWPSRSPHEREPLRTVKDVAEGSSLFLQCFFYGNAFSMAKLQYIAGVRCVTPDQSLSPGGFLGCSKFPSVKSYQIAAFIDPLRSQAFL